MFRAKVGREMERRLLRIGAQVESTAVKSVSKDQPVRRTASGNLVSLERATPGAPPRVLHGRLRQSITHLLLKDGRKGLRVRIGTNVVYGRSLEFGGHPWLRPALTSNKRFILKTLGRGFKKRAKG